MNWSRTWLALALILPGWALAQVQPHSVDELLADLNAGDDSATRPATPVPAIAILSSRLIPASGASLPSGPRAATSRS